MTNEEIKQLRRCLDRVNTIADLMVRDCLVDLLEQAENTKSRSKDRAYETGYNDGYVHYELDHCSACKNVADLQEALDNNIKLRELVRDVWHLFIEYGAVDPCDLPVVDAVRDRIHELKVEIK